MKSTPLFVAGGLCLLIVTSLCGCSGGDSGSADKGPAPGSATPGGGTITAKSMPATGPHKMMPSGGQPNFGK